MMKIDRNEKNRMTDKHATSVKVLVVKPTRIRLCQTYNVSCLNEIEVTANVNENVSFTYLITALQQHNLTVYIHFYLNIDLPEKKIFSFRAAAIPYAGCCWLAGVTAQPHLPVLLR